MCNGKTCLTRRIWAKDEKRLKQYPAAIRKIKRLRRQIRDLNRALNKRRSPTYHLGER